MRKIIFSIEVSLDGFIAGADGNLDWVIVDEELHQYANNLLRGTDLNLFGRKMYETLAAYWPHALDDATIPEYMADFARLLNPIKKSSIRAS
jgi:dihydrofolate reductase